MMEWVSTKTRNPVSCDEGKYYLVDVEGYAYTLAMYFGGRWRENYISVITKPVIAWLDDKQEAKK